MHFDPEDALCSALSGEKKWFFTDNDIIKFTPSGTAGRPPVRELTFAEHINTRPPPH